MESGDFEGAERRRSPRVERQVSIVTTWIQGETLKVREEGETESVNAHGALIKLSSNLRPGQGVKIFRPGTQLQSVARVVGNRGLASSGKVLLAVELDRPNLDFWKEITPASPTEPLRFDL
jgi:hypothetical protein